MATQRRSAGAQERESEGKRERTREIQSAIAGQCPLSAVLTPPIVALSTLTEGEWLTLKQWTADMQCDGGNIEAMDSGHAMRWMDALSLSRSLSLPPSLSPFCPSPFVFPIRTANPHMHPPATFMLAQTNWQASGECFVAAGSCSV